MKVIKHLYADGDYSYEWVEGGYTEEEFQEAQRQPPGAGRSHIDKTGEVVATVEH